MWMWLVLLYGVLKGFREIVKKKSMEKSSMEEVLFFYTLIGFILVIPSAFHMEHMPIHYYCYVALKSFLIFVAWICSFKAIKKLPISLYGVLDLSRVLFAMILGVVVLGEVLNQFQIVGLVFVCTGLLLLKWKPFAGKNKQGSGVERIYILLAFISCILNALSGLMDKLLMKEISSSQLQFWYMLFLTIFYFLYLIFSKTKVNIQGAVTNYWIWILSIMFVIGDKALFIANGMVESKITIMTLIKQSCCLVTILAGKIIFKEKQVLYKLFCASVIVAGIVISVCK